MSSRGRALIIGGSVGGLLAGHLLRSIGWDVLVFERATDDLTARGAGLGISEELLEIMRRIGVRFDRSMAVEILSFACLDQSGEVTHEIPRLQGSSAWGRVYRPLRAEFPAEFYRAGASLDRVEQDERSVTAVFSDGARETGDLLIAADGIHSTVRRQFLPAVEPLYAGYVAWRGVVEESGIPPADHAVIFHRLCYCLPEGELALSMPIPGLDEDTRPGHCRYYFIWYRPASYRAMLDLCTDVTGKQHGVAIPPPLIRPELVRELKETARALLPPQVAAVVARTAQPLLQPIFDLEAPRFVFGRVALLGDAATVARPHVAGGVTKAALDAQGLADALEADGDLSAALARYETERRDFDGKLVAYARYLGAYLEGQLKPPAERSAVERHRDPDKLMREYAAPTLLRNPDLAKL
jgi:2-polyprenyl-6-methoxyphenol hydroxylase-like FAD-dependent oxidoreductase